MIESVDSYSYPSFRRCVLRRHLFFQVAFIIAAAALSVLTSSAQTIEMTKIVVRNVSPVIAPNSLIGAKPTTIYRSIEKYLRIEEQSESAQKNLIITRAPESWMINLADKTAKHIVDPGPTFDARLFIFWLPKPPGDPDPDDGFRGLEFGNEALFFRQHDARDLGLRKVDGKDCKALLVKTPTREVTLFLDPETQKPVQIESTKGGKPDFAYRYISYETDLPFDPSLFEPPPGLTITETK